MKEKAKMKFMCNIPALRVFFFLHVPFLLALYLVLIPGGSSAAIYDRVAAFVDDEAITESELQEQYARARKITADITKEEVLNTMINRILLLREAKKYRIEGPSDDKVISEFIDLKVRAFIRIPESAIEDYYTVNSAMFLQRDFDEVREDIEKYLIEKELNEKLKDSLQEFRRSAYIKILSGRDL